ncbi:MAG: glutamate racemase [Desulfovibrionaceae bacterium]
MQFTDNASLPIGIFDSGLGGLTVLHEMSQLLPNESFIYYADSLHNPYGIKKPSQIIEYSTEITEILLKEGVKCIIIACNTASGIVRESLQKKYPHIPFIGMINAGIQAITEKNIKNIALLATESTLKQGFYHKAFPVEAGYAVQDIICPTLVALAEDGNITGINAERAVTEYISTIHSNTEAVLLGCTHFPLFQPFFEKYLDNSIHIINPASFLASEIKAYLITHALHNKKTHAIKKFIVTGNKEIFAYIYSQLFSENILL